MKLPLAAVAFALALPAVAAADPALRRASPTVHPVSFTTYANGFVERGFLGHRTPSNRIYIARTGTQAARWDKWLVPNGWPPARYNDFGRQALVGVFLFGRYDAARVTVAGLALAGHTLELSIEIVPIPETVCVAPPGGGCPMPTVFMPARTSYAYALVALSQAAAANARRVVVTDEVDDPPQVVYIYPPEPPPPPPPLFAPRDPLPGATR